MEPTEATKQTRPDARAHRGLTRQAIVARALEIGNAEDLGAVSLRRVASELGVTPMALYRHFRDKQDLVNAMTEVVLDEFDVTAGFTPEMSWTERLRLALRNYKEQMDARPLALPLSIAYNGDGPPSFWRILEALLTILLDAGFTRREAIVLIRVISNLLAGYLLLLRQGEMPEGVASDARKMDLIRRQFELVLLSLPGEEFPLLTAAAGDLADVWLSDPDRWWRDTSDLIVFGLEGMLAARARAAEPMTTAPGPVDVTEA